MGSLDQRGRMWWASSPELRPCRLLRSLITSLRSPVAMWHASAYGLLPLVFRLRRSRGLPLHVVRPVSPAPLQGHHVIDHVARAGSTRPPDPSAPTPLLDSAPGPSAGSLGARGRSPDRPSPSPSRGGPPRVLGGGPQGRPDLSRPSEMAFGVPMRSPAGRSSSSFLVTAAIPWK